MLRFVHFLLAANAGEVMVFALAIALGLDAPLTVVQILVVNLLTDGLPAVALAVDPPERDAMRGLPGRLPKGSWTRSALGWWSAGSPPGWRPSPPS